FGAFVDIGVHEDGLVHISQISNRHISHPLDVLSVGDIVDVTVLDVDKEKGRISLTMRTDGGSSENHAKEKNGNTSRQHNGRRPQKRQDGDRPKNKQRQNNRDVGTNLGSLLSGLKLN
ncbi:MAG: S1 RNA-binding domain-containing protein, partial [Lachnospiraceae bacterium]|nr:S1 RNA-binding domain-containing protein [Lachnospiraceae bacterium]